jgi:hypothetical protein
LIPDRKKAIPRSRTRGLLRITHPGLVIRPSRYFFQCADPGIEKQHALLYATELLVKQSPGRASDAHEAI